MRTGTQPHGEKFPYSGPDKIVWAVGNWEVTISCDHLGQIGLEAVSHNDAVFYDRRDFRLLRRDGLLWLDRRCVGALVGHVMP